MKKKTEIVSPSMSFKGWKFIELIKGNVQLLEWFKSFSKLIKELIKIVVPLIVSAVTTKNPALTTLFTIIGKFVLDSAEYWFKEKTN